MRDATVEELGARLRREKKALIIAHEHPDGDALGCVVAMMLMAGRMGITYTGYVPGDDPFPPEYQFLPCLSEILRGPFPAADLETTAYILDCAAATRLDPSGLERVGYRINIDHHYDNTRFGELNLVDFQAPSTTEILFRIFQAAALPLDAGVATALYVGLVTDTGRFQYANTNPAAHRMAAALQEAGVDVNAVYRELYETVPMPKLRLLCCAVARMEFKLGGRLAVTWLGEEDFKTVGADESYTEGIIDTLRSVKGVKVAVLVREQRQDARVTYRVSLRSTDAAFDVSSIAHLQRGGGHRQAAGFTSDLKLPDLLRWIEKETASRL